MSKVLLWHFMEAENVAVHNYDIEKCLCHDSRENMHHNRDDPPPALSSLNCRRWEPGVWSARSPFPSNVPLIDYGRSPR